MKILVCYDNSDLSQILTSSAKQYVDKYFVDRLNDVRFLWINLSKQRLDKFINKEENQDISVVFIPKYCQKEIVFVQGKNIDVETYGSNDYQFKETGYGLKKDYQLQYRFLEYIYGSFSKTIIQLDKNDFSFSLLTKEHLTPQILCNQQFMFFNSKQDLQSAIKRMKKETEDKFNQDIDVLKNKLRDLENKKRKCLNNIYIIEHM